MKISNIYEYKSRSGNPPKQIVLFLHGLGADGRDLLGLAPEFATTLPEAVFVSPDAPLPCDMAPMGYQWFSLQEWTPEGILKGVRESAPVLQTFIADLLKKYDLPASKLALAGFSQGTMMSLYAGLRFPEKLAGILGYSGALVEDPVPASLQKIPVHLVHGAMDTVVPASAYIHAMEYLKVNEFPVTGQLRATLMHSIDSAGIDSGRDFLKTVLGA